MTTVPMQAGRVREWWRRKSVQRTFWQSFALMVSLIGAAIITVPLVWMISTSLKVPSEVFIYPPRWMPAEIQWQNYTRALTKIRYFLFVKNTAIITFAAMAGDVLSSSLVAYGFARMRARGREFLFTLLLSTLMLPYIVTLVPTYLLFLKLGWVDTYLPLIVPAWLGNPFYIFLLRQFYATIPVDLDDAARIDGCTAFGIYWRIMLPLSMPALGTIAIFSFFANWSDFLGPLIFLNRPELYTIALGLQFYLSTYGASEFNLLMAASLVSILPPILVFLVCQRMFVEGIALTGMKG